jgi:RNA polymerase primary sigma factor
MLPSRPRRNGEFEELELIDSEVTRVLDPADERALLRDLDACKSKLQAALKGQSEGPSWPVGSEGPVDLAQYVAATCGATSTRAGARLSAVARRYTDLRWRLAMANIRLVAHVAKRFRERGIAYSDLMQEGFCGLLEAIDRFDLSHETKLATYATWWIRQAMQRAVASGAYPVRLSPRHLRQLAQNQEEVEPNASGQKNVSPGASETIRRIHTATRPALSLDATFDSDGRYSLMHLMSDPEPDRTTDDAETAETVGRLMQTLRPREQEVIALRYGLGGQPRLSLSQVGKALSVSKERVRQIQDRALQKLRGVALERHSGDLLTGA